MVRLETGGNVQNQFDLINGWQHLNLKPKAHAHA
jgi:hypothetical protein